MASPALLCDRTKLRHNARELASLCHRNGMTCAFVTKVVCADPNVVRILEESEADLLADSRLQNLAAVETGKPKLLLRIAMPSEAEDVVRLADMSLESEIGTIRRLGAAAKRQGRHHRVVLMVDLGDLREGIWFENAELLDATARAVLSEPALELYGVGANLTCYGGILPDERNLGALVGIAARLRETFHVPLPFVSGGNSSTLTLLCEGRVPKGITNLRLGESLMLGNDTAALAVLPGLFGDAFTLSAELVEIQKKPGVPLGTSGANAFGERPVFAPRGDMVRGILAIGRQDADCDGLTPLDPAVSVIGASSDHLLVDLTAAPQYRVGDVLNFLPNYGALLRASTSPYVEKRYR